MTSNSILNLSAKQLGQAVKIRERIAVLEAKLAHIIGADSGPVSVAKTGPKRRKMSAAGKARIAAAARARWARLRAAKLGNSVAKRN
jgi:hypothetical protein